GVRDRAALRIDKAERARRVDALIDVAVNIYGPLPARNFTALVARIRYGVPQWKRELKPSLARARKRLAHTHVGHEDWYWPAAETVGKDAESDSVRLLAPFDPLVWDRRRFEIFWGWPYRFEAYTPAAKRSFGYYALPLLWRDRVLGWGNVLVKKGKLDVQLGYTAGRPPRERRFHQAVEEELARVHVFLGLGC